MMVHCSVTFDFSATALPILSIACQIINTTTDGASAIQTIPSILFNAFMLLVLNRLLIHNVAVDLIPQINSADNDT